MPDIVTAERLVEIEAQAEASRKHRGVYWNGDIPDLCATVRKLEDLLRTGHPTTYQGLCWIPDCRVCRFLREFNGGALDAAVEKPESTGAGSILWSDGWE